MNNLQKTVRRNVEDGFVLDWSGEWVALERAIARDIEARAHLEIGEVYHKGHWVLPDEIESEEEIEAPPQPALSAAKIDDDSDPLADEDTVTLRVAADEQSTKSLDAADEPVPPEQSSDEAIEEDTTQICLDRQRESSDGSGDGSSKDYSQACRGDTRPITVPGRPDTVLVEVAFNETAGRDDAPLNADEEAAGATDPDSRLLDAPVEKGEADHGEKPVSQIRPKKRKTDLDDDIDEWEKSRTGLKQALIVAGASAVTIGGITYALLRFVF